MTTWAARETLLDAIVSHADICVHQFDEITEHGADAGWPGFTYNSEAIRFYEANEDAIYGLLYEVADEMGCENIDQLTSGFRRSDMLQNPGTRKVLLSWFALEEVARAVSCSKSVSLATCGCEEATL